MWATAHGEGPHQQGRPGGGYCLAVASLDARRGPSVDRISALRNVEEALAEFERGETDLSSTERRIVTVIRTYATEFESEAGAAAYRATGDERADGLVVVADSSDAARDRIRDLLDDESVDFDVERV